MDPIDALEIAICVSERYGIQLRSDDPDNKRIFASLRSLAAHIAAQLPRRPKVRPPQALELRRIARLDYHAPDQGGAAQRSLDDTLFWRPDEAVAVITGAMFLRAAARVAAAMPPADTYMNLCRDAGGAAIAVAAAVVRGRPCILATDHSEAGIAALQERFPQTHPVLDGGDHRCCVRFDNSTVADPAAW